MPIRIRSAVTPPPLRTGDTEADLTALSDWVILFYEAYLALEQGVNDAQEANDAKPT